MKPFINTKQIMRAITTQDLTFNSYVTAARALANYCDWADRQIEELEFELAKYRERGNDHHVRHTDYDGQTIRDGTEKAFHCINGGEGE